MTVVIDGGHILPYTVPLPRASVVEVSRGLYQSAIFENVTFDGPKTSLLSTSERRRHGTKEVNDGEDQGGGSRGGTRW